MRNVLRREWMVIMDTVSWGGSRVVQWRGRHSRWSKGLDVIRERKGSERRKEEMNSWL